jgi:excisionase family DNA binding protein
MADLSRDPPFTPQSLAERWGVSRQHIYDLIKSEQLKSFSLGRKLVRIPAEEVARWEALNTGSESSTADTSSHGGRKAEDAAIASVLGSHRLKLVQS